jgi:hypothetical protein
MTTPGRSPSHENLRRCERLVARSALLDTSDLRWEDAATRRLPPEAVRALAYMRDVENFTNRDLVGLAGHPATLADPLVARFLDAWRAEEAEHARALDRFLTAYCQGRGEPVPPLQAPPPATPALAERALVALTRPLGHVVTTVHMTWGALNELLTLNGYRLLARRTAHPLLAELLRRIAAQEARHYAFYLLQAEYRLAESRVARTVVPALVGRTWTPVGVGDGYKPAADFEELLGYLADGPRGERALRAMDESIARLPGFAGRSAYSGVTGASRARQAAQVPRNTTLASSTLAPGTSTSSHRPSSTRVGTSASAPHTRHTKWWCQPAATS